MFKSVGFYASFNERTGYGQHATNFVKELEKLIPINKNDDGEVNISLLDVVTAAHTTIRRPYPSILWTVWESTEYPAEFMDKIKLYDQMWVVSEWERSCAITQGIPEEFVKVIHEGVDSALFKPHGGFKTSDPETFNLLHVGQWQPRKSTLEICQSFLRSFPKESYEFVRLYLSADTLFPSDNYKSTEERLEAYGVNDTRIIPVHFEERDAYIGRLQNAHVFVSCSRAEGWNLPLCDAMACGIPSIVADWSGSTEYAMDALKVRVLNFKKPEGIYGNWDVPGKWGEPDYNHLVEVMKDAYENYSVHKEKALKTSDMIRTKFSWEAAAMKSYEVLDELSKCNVLTETDRMLHPANNEKNVTSIHDLYKEARRLGFEIKEITPRKEIFAVDCWPNSKEKLDTLSETIRQIHSLGIPVLVSSHYSLPKEIMELADYYLYEKRDIMSGDDKPIYWRQKLDGIVEQKQASVEYQGVAALNCTRNSVDFCKSRYDWIYQMGADMEVDLNDWIHKVRSSEKDLICIAYEGRKDGFGGGLMAGKSSVYDRIVPYLDSWEQYAKMYPDVKFVAERWFYNYAKSILGDKFDETVEWIECSSKNRFDNVDREIWENDEFQCNFIEGPFLNIVGISNREYDVTFENPIDGKTYGLKQKPGTWARPTTKYFRDWTIEASLNGELKFRHKLDLRGKRVIIGLGSKALGDTIAWIPYIEEFRKKHGCHVLCATWWNLIMDYPDIEFIYPGSAVEDIYATYEIGCFDGQLDKNVTDWRITPLQKVSADILGIDYEPIRARLKYQKNAGNGHPYVCISEFSTMRNKMWNREGAWQTVVDYLVSLGYECVSISAEKSALKNVTRHCGQSVEQTLTDLSGAEFYVGLNHGPVWLAYALGIPALMITGVSAEFNDFPNPYRVSVNSCTPGCFNDPSIPIDRGFEWCPRNKDYACTKEITETMVIQMIDKIKEDLCLQQYPKIQEEVIKSEPQIQSMPKRLHSRKRNPNKDFLTPSITDGNQPVAD